MSDKVVVPRFTHGIAVSISGSNCRMPKGTICPYRFHETCERNLWKQSDNDFIFIGRYSLPKYTCMNGCGRMAYDFTNIPGYSFVRYIAVSTIGNHRCYPVGKNVMNEGGVAIMREVVELSQISRS